MLMLRPEVWSFMDGALITGTAVSEWDRMTAQIGAGNIVLSTNALAAPTGSPLASSALLTTAAGGVAPIFVGLWGAVDMIRDQISDAQAGGLRITALATIDATVARPAQLEVNRPGFTGGQNSRRIARYGTDTKEEDHEAVFT